VLLMKIFYRNRRGQIIGLLLPIITIFMCGIVLTLYLQSQSNLNVAIVSPVAVLELDDSRILFERAEYNSLRDFYCNDVENVGERFCAGFNGLENVGFLKENSNPLTDKVLSGSLCENIYSFSDVGGDLKVSREGLGKKVDLKAEKGPKRVRFNVLLEFELSKEYLLTAEDCI